MDGLPLPLSLAGREPTTYAVQIPLRVLDDLTPVARPVAIWLLERFNAGGAVYCDTYDPFHKTRSSATTDPVYAAVMAAIAAEGWDAGAKVIALADLRGA